MLIVNTPCHIPIQGRGFNLGHQLAGCIRRKAKYFAEAACLVSPTWMVGVKGILCQFASVNAQTFGDVAQFARVIPDPVGVQQAVGHGEIIASMTLYLHR